MGNSCVLCGWDTRGNNQRICGNCKSETKKHYEDRRKFERADRLLNRLNKFHKHLIDNHYPRELRVKMWKNFKPILPKNYQKHLTEKGY